MIQIPDKAISLKQPWAWLIFHGKPVENRDWYSGYRGPLAIHASARVPRVEFEMAVEFVAKIDAQLAGRIPPLAKIALGAIVGRVNMRACVRDHPSPFFQGPFGFVFDCPLECETPLPMKGSLGIWNVTPLELSYGAQL